MNTHQLKAVPFYIIPETDGNVVFHGKSSTLRLRASAAGQIVEMVLPLLDGTLNRAEIRERLGASLPPERSDALLGQLEKHGFILESEAAPADLSPRLAARLEPMRRYLARNGQAGWAEVASLRGAHVAIVNHGSMSLALLVNLLHVGIGAITLVGGARIGELDIARTPFLRSTDLDRTWAEVLPEAVPFEKFNTRFTHVEAIPDEADEWEELLRGVSMLAAVVDGPTYFHRRYAGLNAAALRARTPWMLVGNVQHIGLAVGPTFMPGSTPCLHCFEARLKSNLHNPQLVELLEKFANDGGRHVDFGEIAPGVDVAAHLACLEIVDTLVEGRLAKTAGKLLTVDLAAHELSLHNVLRLPRCPACRPGSQSANTRIWA